VKINTLAIWGVGIASLLFSVLLAIKPELLVALIYARGAFSTSALELTSLYLKYQGFAVVGYALMYYLLQLTLLRDQAKRLMLSYVIGTIAILLLLVFLPFAPYITIGLALTVGVTLSVVVLVG
jgi:peptidoglycan biosynthesis protein MviN/MurJ (putative lipid II flippase)